MNLFLSSYGMGDYADRLLAMTGGPGARMAIITNALDAVPIEAQTAYFRHMPDPLIAYAELGFDPALIDLRRFFGRPDDLATVLRRYRVIFAVGGNCFLLRRAMRDSGFDGIIRPLLAEGVVYAGYSAGACVMGDDMRPLTFMDNPDERAPGYVSDDPIMTGLGLVPFAIIPHVDSDSTEAEAAAQGVAFARAEGIAHAPLRDGEVIVRQGETIETLPRTSP
jgi:dipeptidase E